MDESARRTPVARAVTEAMGDRAVDERMLADATGISPRSLRELLAGTRPFTLEELEAVGEALGQRSSDLLQHAAAITARPRPPH